MPEPELARREGIELIRTGSWGALTGTWNPTRADILAAVEAQQCPAVRRPRLKLGHTDPRFNKDDGGVNDEGPGDGEPALGWFENLRATDNGDTLVGDQVALPWLNAVQAAAYPDRSIEGNYRHRCSLGHTHPFVVTAVALLGVTPPAVSTLRSVQDLPAMLGVAASTEVPEGAQHVQVTILAAEQAEHTSAVVVLVPSAEDAERLAIEGGEPAEELHVTLAYLGDAAALGAQGRQDVIDAVSTAVNGLPQFTAEVFSVAAFNPPGPAINDGRDRTTCLVWGLSGDLIDAVHGIVTEALWAVPASEQHRPWHCHMTAAYSSNLGQLADLATRTGSVRFDRIRMAFTDDNVDIPLIPDEDQDTIAAAGQIVTRLAAIREARVVQARYRPDQKRDGDGRWTDGTAGHGGSPATSTTMRLRGGDGRGVFVETSTDGSLSIKMPFDGSDDYDPDDPDTAHLRHVDTIRLDRDTATEFAEDLDLLLQDRAAYTKRAQAAWDALESTDPADANYPAVQDAWFDIGGDGQRIAGGELDGDTGALVYELRMGDEATDTEFVMAIRPNGVDPDGWDLHDAAADQAGNFLKMPGFRRIRKALEPVLPVAASAAPVLPAAEPEQPPTDPKEEDPVSDTDLSGLRSRLGLTDDADQEQILSAIDALKAKADTPAQPSPEMVAASSAATAAVAQAEAARTEMQTELARLSGELASIKASAATNAKTNLFDSAVTAGKIKPADRESWEGRYDKAPDVITEILASIAPGTAVPVMASGTVGSPEPGAGSDDDWDDIVARLDGPNTKAV